MAKRFPMSHVLWAFDDAMDACDMECMRSWFYELHNRYQERGRKIKELQESLKMENMASTDLIMQQMRGPQ